MNVILARTAGFCMGVALALRKLDEIIESAEGARIFTLGPIIHNPQVLEEYAGKGVGLVQDPAALRPGDHVVIRAHGIPREAQALIEERGVRLTDATCPKVKKAQMLIDREAGRGRRLLLFGERDHPEVKGLLSYALPGARVFETADKIPDIPREEILAGEKYFLAAQTTQDRTAFTRVAKILNDRLGGELHILNTICDATMDRQREAIDIARQADLMIVVGGRESGNTRRLVTVAEAQGTPCLHVETVHELPLERLRGLSTVGLTAGASTPKRIIDEVHARLYAL